MHLCHLNDLITILDFNDPEKANIVAQAENKDIMSGIGMLESSLSKLYYCNLQLFLLFTRVINENGMLYIKILIQN